MDFGSKIKSAREDMDLTQVQMAKLVPMNQSNYSKIERGVQEPNLYQLRRITEILNLDLYAALGIEPRNQNKIRDYHFLEEIIALYHRMYP